MAPKRYVTHLCFKYNFVKYEWKGTTKALLPTGHEKSTVQKVPEICKRGCCHKILCIR